MNIGIKIITPFKIPNQRHDGLEFSFGLPNFIWFGNFSNVFRSQKKFSTTYASLLVHFFLSRPFNEKSKFLENCPYDFHIILHSHSTSEGAPACAMTSRSYDWDSSESEEKRPKSIPWLFSVFPSPPILFWKFCLINFQCDSLELRYKICSHYFSLSSREQWIR